MTSRAIAGFVLAVVIGTAATGCCGPAARTPDPGAGSAEATVTAEATEGIPPTTTDGTSGLDPDGFERELDAMERELDSMEMPSDADFSDAEGALY